MRANVSTMHIIIVHFASIFRQIQECWEISEFQKLMSPRKRN